MNKCTIELTKEELLVLIEGLDYQRDMESVIFSEYNIDAEKFSNKLEKIFYSLEWKQE